jgi:hypothetical protein
VSLIDEARRGAATASPGGTLSMRSPSRLLQESAGDALARMKQQGRLAP